MRLRNRILKVKKVLPVPQQNNETNEQERVCEWLVKNSEEFRDCVRQNFRIQCESEQHNDNWEQWQEPYREQASICFNRINELKLQYKKDLGIYLSSSDTVEKM